MIRCPKCGKMNQDSSRFCNQCGATLPQTRIRCPQCGFMNPIGNVFCSQCNTRLLSTEMQLPEKPKPVEETSVGVKGISLPTLSAGKEGALEPEELPDWLLELTEQSRGKPAETPDITEPATADQPPDWLSGLVDETSDLFAAEDMLAPEEAAASEDALAPTELPDWFSELAAGVPAPEETVLEETAASATPDWFADLLEDEAAGAAEAEVETASSLVEAATEELALEELPDWLSDLTPEEPAAVLAVDTFDMAPPPPAWETAAPASNLPAEPRAELPDWLIATATPTPPGDVSALRPLPEWLLKNAEEPAPGQEVGGQELPGWLMKGAEAVVAPRTPASPLPPSAEVQARVRPAAEAVLSPLPAAEPEEEAAPAEDVPDWLAGIYNEEEPELQAAAATAEPEAVPDWLAGIYSEEEPEPQAATATAEPEAEAVPDWLAGIMAEEPVPVQPQALSEGEEAAPGEGIPDWLAGLAAEAPAAEEDQPSPFAADRSIFTEAVSEEPQAGPSATPDWLKGMTPLDETAARKPAQPAFVPGEAAFGALEDEDEEPALEADGMDWLKGLSHTAPGQLVAEEEAAFYERVSEDESLVRAEVPSWLQGLRPPGTGPLPPLPEVMTLGADIPLPQEGGLVRAEIPDWVQQLRPVPSAAGEEDEKRVLEPAETEGPLTGLRGVLPVGLLVDMPADFQPAPPPAIPESIVAQAQLWQQLLEQPRSVLRPVAQHRVRSGSGQLATRWIVTVVLLTVTMLGLFWGDAPLSQALSSPHIERFYKAINALEPGDTVIVAVEYGPAEAGEMTALAQAVIQHLADQNARVMMVSTLPEGAGLIHSLLAPLALANRLPAEQTAYLPGSSSGVAQFLAEPSDAVMLVVLAGRAERLRWWVEQNNATQAMPMNVGVNAATAPLAMPYLETSLVAGWMAGLPDMAAYQEFRGLTSSVLDSQLDALMLTHWAALALLLFGLFYYLALGKKGAS